MVRNAGADQGAILSEASRESIRVLQEVLSEHSHGLVHDYLRAAALARECDAFIAMMRHRPYIDAITVVEALAELRRCSGSQFDPRVVEAFEETFHELFDHQ
ncbi:MAG TPA: hypothetical protein VMF09_13950 [Solirubrobacteraceae bacterium]|nr:hypothetical protein [Solirubrobacteraceae bacterium]